MPKTIWLIAASAALAAAPAAAQTNNADQAVTNETAVTATTDANLSVDANLVAAPVENAMEPAAPIESEVATRAADDNDGKRGFPWGIIGLVGLIGLLGRRKS